VPITLNLADWPVARRLFTVITAALLMGLVFGGLRVADAESSASQFGQTAQLAQVGGQLTILINDLQNERDATVTNIDSDDSTSLKPLYAKTDTDLPGVIRALDGIGGGFPENIRADVATVLSDLGESNIAQLHSMLDPAVPLTETSVILNYGAVIDDMIALADEVAQGVSDAQLTSDVRTFNELALIKEQVSQQRALLNYGFENPEMSPGQSSPDQTYVSMSLLNAQGNAITVTSPFFDPTTIQLLTAAYYQEFIDESGFKQSATPAEQAYLANALAAKGQAPYISYAENVELIATSDLDQAVAPGVAPGNSRTALAGSPMADAVVIPGGPVNIPLTPSKIAPDGLAAWDKGMSDKLNALQSTELLISGNIVSRANQLQSDAQQTALTYLITTLAVLLIVLLATLLVARSLVLPLRRLRAGALDIASVQLPDRVRLLSENPEAAATMQIAPINVTSRDEIGQVARAFDQVHSEAVRLAGEQALLQTSFNAMFVNLSRRSQSLIERLARMIDTLEQSEDDPGRLGSLFSMDHLVTRMRRNSENLLLLAGHENPRKWSEPVPLADVARAAASEIEQYNRITLNISAGVAVIGQAVSDVVHLLAELVENATIFSPKDTQVTVTMQELASGGVLIEILDQGIGVSEARLADMNWRLDNPPTIDVSVSRHMGLFAVARLAERHRVRVRLRPASPQGLSALVWLPDSVIERVGTYGVAGTWSTQPVAAQATAGMQQVGAESAGLPDGAVALPQAGGHPGNGNGNGHGASPQAARTASGWFRGRGGAPDGAADGGFGTPRLGNGRNPADIIADPAFSDQTTAGLPMRVPKANLIPGRAPGGMGGGQSGPSGAGPTSGPGGPAGPGSGGGAVSQAGLPIRGADPGGNGLPSRGPAGRAPTGNGSQSLPQRSPEHARSRLAGFQRGTRRAESHTGQTGQTPRAGEGSER